MGFIDDIMKTIPIITSKCMGILIIILNCTFCGVGTMIASGMDTSNGGKCNTTQLCYGILQFVIPLVGWVWSWIWGFQIYYRIENKTQVPQTDRSKTEKSATGNTTSRGPASNRPPPSKNQAPSKNSGPPSKVVRQPSPKNTGKKPSPRSSPQKKE